MLTPFTKSRVLPIIASSSLLLLASPVSAATSLQITTPTQNQKFESDKLTVSWTLTDWQLKDYATSPKPRPREGHIHLWLDEANPTPTNATKITSGTTYELSSLTQGTHTLTMELVGNDHASLRPPIRQTVTFESVAPVFVNPPLPKNDFSLFLILVAIVLVGGLWYFLSPEATPPTAPIKPISHPNPKTKSKKSPRRK